MPVDLQKILELAPMVVAAMKPGSPEAAAFMQGFLRSKEQMRQRTLQEQNAQSEQAFRQAQLENLSADNARADEALNIQRQNARTNAFRAYHETTQLPEAVLKAPELAFPANTDPLATQNQNVINRLTDQQELKIPAGTPQGPLPNVTALVSEAKKRRARQFVADLEKTYGPEAVNKDGPGGIGTPTQGEFAGMNPSQIRALYATPMMTETGQAPTPYVKPTTAPPALGSQADYLARWAKEHGVDVASLTTDQMNTALKEHTVATQRPTMLQGMNALYADVDPKSIAAAIREGTHPPDISQYGRPAQAAIASELSKVDPNTGKRFNLSAAQREWKAQINLNRTMNNAQQVRLDESIRSGLAMYDKIDQIADQWDGKGWGPLSKANLEIARQGGKGPEAQSLANQLTGQIGQLTSDVATIEQGGLTPTEEARHIAQKSMQDWWGRGTIRAMTAQGRYNMQIRHMARNTQDIMVPGNGFDLRPAEPATPPSTTPQKNPFRR